MKPNRRLLIGAGLAVVALAAAAYWWPGRDQANLARISGQNVLLITIDTLRADALGIDGGPAHTPALDRLAAEGVHFDFAHAHSVLTLPSHTSILTGQYPFQHGIRDNSGYRLPGDARTAATLFKKAGYATAAFIGAFPLHSGFGLDAGFDVYDDRFGNPSVPSEFNMSERPASVVVPLAQKWIAATTTPWFSWVHVFDPHAPYRPPPPFDAQFTAQPYYGEVSAADAALAPLLDAVRASARPTLVIVTGDHGEGLGEHGEEAHGIFAYESTLRIPLIIAELGGASTSSLPSFMPSRAGERSSVGARHIDILPTMLDAVGQPVPADLSGRSLLPREERAAGAPQRITYFEAMAGMLNHGWAPLTGVLVGRDKLIDVPILERYDLSSDAKEQRNLAGSAPDRDRVLQSTLAGLAPTRPGERAAENAEATARLRSLGYVSAGAAAKAQYTEADDPKRLIELDQMIHRALNAFGEGRVVEAEDLYRKLIDRRPDLSIAYRHIALIEWQAGNAATAIAVLRRGLTQGVTDPRAIAQLGEYLTDTGSVAEGLRLLEPLGRDAAADTDTLNALGITYARARRPADARAVFERLSAMMPTSSAPLENLGVLALDAHDLARASVYFDRALAVNPASARAENGRAAIAFERGDRAGAYAAWMRAIAADPANLDALFSLGVNLMRDGRSAEARPYLLKFLQTAPPAMTAERREAERLLAQR